MLPRLTARRSAAIGNAFLRGRVTDYKYRIATNTHCLILQLPNAVTGDSGAIVSIHIAYGDARSDIRGYSGYLYLVSARCKCDPDTSR
jgi:hypothetical protein